MQYDQGWRARRWIDLAIFAGALMVIGGFATLFHQSASKLSYAPHFVVQAQRLLHGRWDVTGAIWHDYVLVGGKEYIVYPPMPSLLMIPFVALLKHHFSDVWFTWCAGALNIVLLFRLLEAVRAKGWAPRTAREDLVIAATFGFGTIALWLTLGGSVWFTAQTLAITFLLGMLWACVTRRWWFAAASLGAVFLTRSPDVFAGLFIPVAVIQAYGLARYNGKRWVLAHLPERRVLLALVMPLAVALVIWGWRNFVSFGSVFESGYNLQLRQNYSDIHYGLLSWHYIWPNFVVDFLSFPSFNFAGPFDTLPAIDFLHDGNGTCIFFTTPLVLLFFLPQGPLPNRWLRATAWVCVAVLLGFALFWNGTGWYQVGARYLFDAYPFLFLLLALRVEPINARWLILAGLGVMANIILAKVFWCNNGACFGAAYSTKHIFYTIALACVPLLVLLTGWWLHVPGITQKVGARFHAGWPAAGQEPSKARPA